MNKTNEKVKHNNIIVKPQVLEVKPNPIEQRGEMAVAAPVKKKEKHL